MHKKGVNLPDWFGSYPFKPHEKRPCVLKECDGLRRIYGRAPHDIETHLHVSTDRVTCSEFRVRPGEYFDPPDIHSGDEVYYILRGKATVFNPDDGDVRVAEEGDFFLIPGGVWHQTFNFSDAELVILTAFGKDMLALDEGWPHITYTKKPVYFKGAAGQGAGRLTMLGNLPSVDSSREQGRDMTAIRKGEALNLIHGETNHVLVSFYVSNDTLHSGLMTVPAGGRSDPEAHKGDEVTYCLRGRASVLIAGHERDSTSVEAERYEVRPGDRLLIPEGVEHRYINFAEETAELLFTIAPEL